MPYPTTLRNSLPWVALLLVGHAIAQRDTTWMFGGGVGLYGNLYPTMSSTAYREAENAVYFDNMSYEAKGMRSFWGIVEARSPARHSFALQVNWWSYQGSDEEGSLYFSQLDLEVLQTRLGWAYSLSSPPKSRRLKFEFLIGAALDYRHLDHLVTSPHFSGPFRGTVEQKDEANSVGIGSTAQIGFRLPNARFGLALTLSMASYVWGERQTTGSLTVVGPPFGTIDQNNTERYAYWSGPGVLSDKSVLFKDIGPYFILLF